MPDLDTLRWVAVGAGIVASYASSEFWKSVVAIPCFMVLFGPTFGWLVALKRRR